METVESIEPIEPGALTNRVQWLGVALEALLRDLGAALGEIEALNMRLESAERRISELESPGGS
jgi:hypothetical protein